MALFFYLKLGWCVISERLLYVLYYVASKSIHFIVYKKYIVLNNYVYCALSGKPSNLTLSHKL